MCRPRLRPTGLGFGNDSSLEEPDSPIFRASRSNWPLKVSGVRKGEFGRPTPSEQGRHAERFHARGWAGQTLGHTR